MPAWPESSSGISLFCQCHANKSTCYCCVEMGLWFEYLWQTSLLCYRSSFYYCIPPGQGLAEKLKSVNRRGHYRWLNWAETRPHRKPRYEATPALYFVDTVSWDWTLNYGGRRKYSHCTSYSAARRQSLTIGRFTPLLLSYHIKKTRETLKYDAIGWR